MLFFLSKIEYVKYLEYLDVKKAAGTDDVIVEVVEDESEDKPTTSKSVTKTKDPATNLEIDESLFNADDLDGIDDELDELEIED